MNWLKGIFEISHTNHKSIYSMEGIRGFAVFLVFLVHYVSLSEPWLEKNSATFVIANYMHAMGNIGVDLFFVLSGYLIYGLLIKKERPFLKYILRRIQRIYPTFTVVLVLYLALSLAFPSESKIPSGWAGVVFVLQNFLLLPGLFPINAIIVVAWSLSYEFFYYLAMPLLIMSLRMRTWPASTRAVFFVILSVMGFSLVAYDGGPVRLMMFLSGVLLFEAVESRSAKISSGLGLLSLVVAIGSVIAMSSFKATGWWTYATLYVLFFLFCLECFTTSGLATQIFTFTPLRWLGNMSYSYYLIHGLALKFLFLILTFVHRPEGTDAFSFWLLFPVFFGFSLVPAAILFTMIEKPFSLITNSESSIRSAARV